MSTAIAAAPITAPPLPATPTATRWLGLDLARLVASWAIIWIHVPRSGALMNSTLWCRFAVPFFTCTAVVFVLRKTLSDGGEPWWRYVLSRVGRIYGPYLAWQGAYWTLKRLKRLALPEQDNDGGGAYHLWFLPFILAVSVASYVVALVARLGRGPRLGVAAAAALAGWAIAIAPPPGIFGWHNTYNCMWFALPAAAWGICFGALGLGRSTMLGGLRVGVPLFVAAELAIFWTGSRHVLLENLAGVGFMLAALAWRPGERWARLARLGTLAYGIYCSHLMFIKMAESVFAKLRWPVTPELDVTIFLVAVAGSGLAAWLLSRWRLTRWLVA